jgi:competence protein ComEC
MPAGGDRWPDLRLVALAVATWLSALATLPTRAPVAVLVGAAALVGFGLLWRSAGLRHRPGSSSAGWFGAGWSGRTAGLGVLAAVLLGVACGSVATGARLAARDAEPVAQPARDRAAVTVELTVRRDPHPLGQEAGRPPSWLIRAWLHRIADPAGPEAGPVLSGPAPVRVRARLLVFASDTAWQSMLPGQRVRATGRLGPARGGDLTAAVLSASGPPELLGEPPWPQRAAGSLRAGLQAAAAPLPDRPGGLLPGLAVGDVSALDPGVTDDFRTTGMSHLVAVSGANVAIIVGCVALLAGAARAPRWLTVSLSAVALVGFVILCRADPSVLRAGAMGAIALLALAAGRPRAAMPALAATVTALVVIDPQLAAEPGLALSVLATGGLLVLAPRWRDALRRRGIPRGMAEAVAIPAAAQVAVAPLIAGLSGTVSLVAVAANLVAAPAVAPATVLGVLAAVVSPVWPPAAELLAWLGCWPAWWLVLVASYGARVPAAAMPWPDGVAGALLLTGLTVGALVAFRHRRTRLVLAVVAAAAVLGAVPVRLIASGWPPAGTLVVACAVGQGDLLVLPAGAGAAVVVDTGPEPAAADRCLRDLRVRAVPLLLVSHFHADHVGGVAGVFRHRQVAGVLIPPWPEPEPGHRQLTRAAAGRAPVQVARAGAVYRVGELSLTVLGPPHRMSGTRSDPNNNSLVVLAERAGVRMLLTGDAELELQQALLDEIGAGRLRADILKVPHHGSAFQDQGFLAAVAPAVAIVPVGADNAYGHPDPALLAQLSAAGVRVLRTDVDGDLAAVRRESGELAVVTRTPLGAAS